MTFVEENTVKLFVVEDNTNNHIKIYRIVGFCVILCFIEKQKLRPETTLTNGAYSKKPYE